ncbi:MAG TPA: hypothetical protein VMU26_29400 [Candidatus Polarisedimenticolia bacterium]|nr:hypothetical protein [Candidatus Polarisedimenticolia bacterium]
MTACASTRRNRFTQPGYSSTNLRPRPQNPRLRRYRLEFTADAFRLFNRANQRVTITSNGLTAEATTFTPSGVYVNGVPYPAYLQPPKFPQTQRSLGLAEAKA